MKKKNQFGWIKLVGMLFCVIVCILTFSKEVFADENKYITVTYKKNISSGFLYSDDMMLTNANNLSTDVAKMAMGLANVAYDESAVKQCLSTMGYSLLGGDTYNYTKNTYTYTNNDYVDYSIGYKEYKGYNIYLVVIKGTGTNYDWFSNFNLGKGDYHQGFKLAADGVLNTINSKVSTSNNIFLVTGHSRGAAVANIVAAELTADGSFASSDHIFGYTYACPAVKIGADTSYSNIRNYNNYGDAVPELPLEAWGYERYGETINLSTQSDIYQNFKQRFKSVEGEDYAGVVNTDSFVSVLLAIADTRDAYYNPDNHLWFDFFAYLLGPASRESIDWKIVAQIIKDNDITGATASCLQHILQDAVSTGITALSQVENSEGSWKSEFMSRIDSSLLETKEYTDEEFETWLSNEPAIVAEIRRELHIEVETRASLVGAQRTLESELDNYSQALANGETLLYLFFSTDFKPVSAIRHGHQPSTYVLWINSMYYGYEGWKGNTGNIAVDWNRANNIGDFCFSYCENIEKLIIPDSVSELGGKGFWNCTGLREIMFPQNLKSIAAETFKGCSGIIELELPCSIEYIGKNAFEGCIGIKELKIPNNKVSLNDAFSRCDNIKKLILPIDHSKPYLGCVNVEEITYTPGQNGIMANIGAGGNDAFDYSRVEYMSRATLKKVEFEEGVKEIGNNAFYWRHNWWYGDFITKANIEKLYLPSTLEKIGDYAFCEQENLDDIILPKNLKEVGYYSFAKCLGLSSLKVPNSEINFNKSFVDCSNLKKIIMPVDLQKACLGCSNVEEILYTVGETGIMPSKGWDSVEATSCKALKKVTFENGVKEIGDNAYKGDGVLEEVYLADTIKKIGWEAFANQKKINQIVLPKEITEIGGECFRGCVGIEEIDIPETITCIKALTFLDCAGLKKVIFPESLTTIERYAFSGCSEITEISIPEKVAIIEGGAFADCSKLSKINIPTGIERLRNDVFSGCKGITEIEIPETVGQIEADAFSGCSGLKKIKIPKTVSTIYSSAFENCSNLEEVEIDNSNLKLYQTAFKGCLNVKKIIMPVDFVQPYFGCTSVEEIVYKSGKTGIMQEIQANGANQRDEARVEFTSRHSLKKVTFEEGVKKIGANAYYWSAYSTPGDIYKADLQEVNLPNTLKSIGSHAFREQTQLKKLILPSGLKSIGAHCFDGCSDLTIWTYKESFGEEYANKNSINTKCFYYPYINNKNKNIVAGNTYQFGVKVYTGIDEYIDEVEWSLENAGCGKTFINENGLLTVDKNESSNTLKVIAKYNENIASFEMKVHSREKYNITYELNGGSNNELNPREYLATDPYIELKDPQRENYVFLGWYTAQEGGMRISSETELSGDIYLYARWQGEPCEIIYDANGGVLWESNNKIVNYGEALGKFPDCTLNGYSMVGWFTDKGELVTPFDICKGNMTVYAQWKKLEIDLSICEIQLSDTAYVYDGTAKEPDITVIYDGSVLTEKVDYIRYYTDNIDPGTATVIIEAAENSSYTGSVQKNFEIRPAMDENTIIVQPNAFKGCSNLMNLNIRATVTEIGEQAFADCKNLRNVYFYGNCPKIGKDIFANVKTTVYYPYKDTTWTLDKLQDYGGTVTWCPWDPETGKPAKRDLSHAKITVDAKNLIYDGKAKTPEITAEDGSYVLQPGTDYTISYKNNVNAGTAVVTATGQGNYGGTISAQFIIGKAANVIKVSDISRNFSTKAQTVSSGVRVYGGAKLTYSSNNKSVKVDKAGKITIAKNFVGKAVITVKVSETSCYKAASSKFAVTVKPAVVTISKAVNSAKKKITVSWKTNKTCSGYAVQYSTDKNFRRGVKTVYVGKNSTAKVNLSKLVKGKTYYIRLASYKKVGSEKILSNWSKVKTVKVRK